MRALPQPLRLVILLLYVAGLFVASKIALGTWVPPATEQGLWFYSGLAALLLGNLLVTPFYTKPADAISYAVAALVALLAVGSGSTVGGSHGPSWLNPSLWFAALSYILLVLAAAIASISLKDSRKPALRKTANSLRVLTDNLGSPIAIFSSLFLFALVSFHRQAVREYLTIGIAWAITVGTRPLETIADVVRRWWEIWRPSFSAETFGEVVGHETPGIVLIRHEPDQEALFGDAIIARSDDGRPGLGLALDYVGFAEGRWLRVLHVSLPDIIRASLSQYCVDGDAAVKVSSQALQSYTLTDPIWTKKQRLLGLVAADTDISKLVVEVVRTDVDLQEGRLLEVSIGATAVLYQVIDGMTKEEILLQKNTRGYVRIHAKKIGKWNSEKRCFDVVKWIPRPNAPVFLEEASDAPSIRDAIGYFPGTAYPVMVDAHPLVTHNAAILGILGAGKSFLALELVERMLASGVKVICLDLTNQYADALGEFFDLTRDSQELSDLSVLGPPGKTNCQQNVEEGGSVGAFRKKLHEQLQLFLDPADPRRVKIYNPVQFEVWRQDSRPFSGTASMASLTPTEIARVFTEEALAVLQKQGMTDQARCCLVFEEAHSLIPEWNAVASDGDRTATNGTAKAILQGRKYGLGCLVITQRTANVTKSILNQCNTIFAMRVFDSTGMEFLRNYVGEDYAAVLSTLEDRHAVVFGRGSSCRDPVLVRLNDRSDFLSTFRPVDG